MCFPFWGYFCGELGMGRMQKRCSSWVIGHVQNVETFATAVFAGEFVSFFFVCVFWVGIVLYLWVHSNRGAIFEGKNEVNYLLVNYFIQPRHLVSSQCLKCLFQRLLNLMIWNWTRWIRFCFQRKLLRKRCATFLPILYPIYLVVDKYTYVCWLKNLLFTYANSWFVNGDRSKNV